MPISLGDLASSQSKVKEKIMEAKTYLINYTATHMSVKMQYHKSIMMIHIHSDGFYLSAPKAYILVGFNLFLSDKTFDPGKI